MLYREQRGGLAESMKTVRVFSLKDEFLNCIASEWDVRPDAIFDEIEVRPYGWDHRIGWDTHIVTVRGKGIGFTDGPLP